MKHCTSCNQELNDSAIFCDACGVQLENSEPPKKTISGLRKATRIFMLLDTIFWGIAIIPLAWSIPMTVSYFRKVKNHQPVGLGFKICTLLFVSEIAGILMLCDNDT